MERINHAETVFFRKIGPVQKNFDVFSWEVVGPDAVIYTGSEFTVDAKGNRHFSGNEKKAVVTDAERSAEMIRYENETGKCSDCCGFGNVVSGWHHKTGLRYKTCARCRGNGRPPQ